jgi:thioredoxin 1
MIATVLVWLWSALAPQPSASAAAPRFTVLFFTAPWCEPCRAVHPILDRFARKHEKIVRVIDMDFDREKADAERWAVENIPVVIVLSRRGELLLRANGASRQTLQTLESDLEELVSKSSRRRSHEH